MELKFIILPHKIYLIKQKRGWWSVFAAPPPPPNGMAGKAELIARICNFSFMNHTEKLIHVPKPQAI